MTKAEKVRARVLERIRRGDYPVGGRLPSLRGLAGELDVHPNTVAQAYRELAEQGVARSEQGKGTFVLRRPEPEDAPPVREALRDDLTRAARRAFEGGIGPEEFLAIAREAATADRGPAGLRAFFVECNPFDTEDLAEHVSRLLGLPFDPLLVDDLRERADTIVADSDLFVTTPYHIDEVEAVVGARAPIVNVSVTPTTRTLVDLARIPEGSRVIVTASNARTLTQLVGLVRAQLRREPASAHLVDDPALAAAVAAGDVVVDSQAIHARVLGLTGGLPVVTVYFQLEANSLEFLRARVRDLFPALTREPVAPARPAAGVRTPG